MRYHLYNSKPTTVRAVKFTGHNVTQTRIFLNDALHQFRIMEDSEYELDIPTRRGMKTVVGGNYITCDEEGEFRVWTEKEFLDRYEATGASVEM